MVLQSNFIKEGNMTNKIKYTGEENAPCWTADPQGWDKWFLAFASRYIPTQLFTAIYN